MYETYIMRRKDEKRKVAQSGGSQILFNCLI